MDEQRHEVCGFRFCQEVAGAAAMGTTMDTAFAIVMLMLSVLSFIWPQRVWVTLNGWQFKNAERIELSAASVMLTRITSLIAAGFLAVFLVDRFK
jgi:hypothetical protein